MKKAKDLGQVIKNLKTVQKEASKAKRDVRGIGRIAPRDNNKVNIGQGNLA